MIEGQLIAKAEHQHTMMVKAKKEANKSHKVLEMKVKKYREKKAALITTLKELSKTDEGWEDVIEALNEKF